MAYLTPEEHDRAMRFRFAGDRERFVLARRMARTILGGELGVHPVDVCFGYSAYGKPELAGRLSRRGLNFNFAHSGSQVAFALAYGRRVGVDVEQEREDLNLMELARRHFCPKEIAVLEREGPRLTRLFFQYWTLKEAYLKAEGSGFSLNLTALDASAIPDEPGSPPSLPIEDVPRGIHVARLPGPQAYAAAVAAAGSGWKVELRHWSDDEGLPGPGAGIPETA